MAGFADNYIAIPFACRATTPTASFSILCSTSRGAVVASHVHSSSAQHIAGGNHGTKETQDCMRQHGDSGHDACARIRLCGAGDSAGTSVRDNHAGVRATAAEGGWGAARTAARNVRWNSGNEITGAAGRRGGHQGYVGKRKVQGEDA